MIRCDHDGCVAPHGYSKRVATAADVAAGVKHSHKVGATLMTPIRPTVGGEPDWAAFEVDGLCYCGWHVDEHDPDGTKRRHVTAITDPKEMAAHHRRQAKGKP